MNVLVTGANGFIGKNLLVRLQEEKIQFSTFLSTDSDSELEIKLKKCDFIVHLAGINRPDNKNSFQEGNVDLTNKIADILINQNLKTPIIFSSSIQAEINNPYGASKKLAENILNNLSEVNGNPFYNYRLPNVFGKWCRPNYNSVVATFCHNIINDLPIQINSEDAIINLVYIDDVINSFIDLIMHKTSTDLSNTPVVDPIYQITVGDLARQISKFKESRPTLVIDEVGTGLVRALYSTYISYYKPKDFSYMVESHKDPRGIFVEMLKTTNSGQFSYFTAHPGITRGGHYHHSKNEKFLVLRGKARFCFRQIITNEVFELFTSGDAPQIVETVPGWSHDITNIGDEEMYVMLWANEIFDRDNPDTIAFKV